MSTLYLDNVSKVYDKSAERAVDSLSMHIEDGEIVALLGSSGCGKTTSLRMVAGLEFDHGRRDPRRRPRGERAQTGAAQRRDGV